MTRVYRIQNGDGSSYVSEREGQWRAITGDIFGAFSEGAEISSEGLKFLAPVQPSKIVCVGLNYKDHAIEQGKPLPPEPLLFIKHQVTLSGIVAVEVDRDPCVRLDVLLEAPESLHRCGLPKESRPEGKAPQHAVDQLCDSVLLPHEGTLHRR